jgi:hypothetical protein
MNCCLDFGTVLAVWYFGTVLAVSHDHSLSCLDIVVSIKGSGAKVVFFTQTSHLSEMMRACMCVPHFNKMPAITHLQENGV